MRLVVGILFSFLVVVGKTQSLNNLKLSDSISSEYSFLVSGHWHGASSNVSGFPASSVLANLYAFNQSGASFIALTGDLFLDVTKDIPNYEQSLFKKINVPLFNAVGNHDISGDVYEQRFGSTWFSFSIHHQTFVFLNTEVNDGSIKGEQLDFFLQEIEDAKSNPDIKQVFVFSHRPIWSEEDEELKALFNDNTKADFSVNYNEEILPALQSLSSSKVVYWFSGSMGAAAPASFFYHQKQKNIFYIQSAIRDLQRDAVLKVNVKNDELSFETVSLNQNSAPQLENCGIELWKSDAGEPEFNYRLIPLYIKQMLFHRYFWYGILSCIIVWLLYRLIVRIVRKKRHA